MSFVGVKSDGKNSGPSVGSLKGMFENLKESQSEPRKQASVEKLRRDINSSASKEELKEDSSQQYVTAEKKELSKSRFGSRSSLLDEEKKSFRRSNSRQEFELLRQESVKEVYQEQQQKPMQQSLKQSSAIFESKVQPAESPKVQKAANSKASSSFAVQKKECNSCKKHVYPLEEISADSLTYHRTCFKCATCSGQLKLGNYAALQGKYYCKPHFKQNFALKGNYNFK